EIDRVLGSDRLPTFGDRQSLPYVEAIYREVMRLHPPFPLGKDFNISSSIEEDSYLDYHIPKGYFFFDDSDRRAMNRDPAVYKRPEEFLPERFLDASSGGPFIDIDSIHAYGFGRRICAGRYMADNTVWLTIASVLATLSFGKLKDKQGNEILVYEEYTNYFLRSSSYPKPFQCSITPRTPHAEKLILATVS
ncbi:cytochrome P450, partial [Gymnopus androsaceus JB14]